MAADLIQVQYEDLNKIALQFGRSAAETEQTFQRLHRQMATLQNGGWTGRGATAFYREMDSEVLPAVKRLHEALRTAQTTTQQVSRDYRQAEEEAARVFRGGAAVGVGIGAGAVLPGVGHTGSIGGSLWDKFTFDNKRNIFELDFKKGPGERANFDLGMNFRYGIHDKALIGDPTKDGFSVLGGSAGAEAGFGQKGFNLGISGEAYALQGKLDGITGTDSLGLSGGVAGTVLKGEGFAGIKNNSVGASIGGTLVSVEGEAGVNVAGANVSVTGEIGLKAEAGIQIGQETKVKLPFVTIGLVLGRAKKD